MESTKVSTNRGTDKEDVVHIHNGILLSHKKNEVIPFASTWMGLEIFISKIKQKYKSIILLICGIFKK